MQCFYIETKTQSMLSDAGTVIDYLIILINKDIYAFDCQAVVLKVNFYLFLYTFFVYL